MKRPAGSSRSRAAWMLAAAVVLVPSAAFGAEIRDPASGLRVEVADEADVCVLRPAPPAPRASCTGPEIDRILQAPFAQNPALIGVVRVAREASAPWLLFVSTERGHFSANPTPAELGTVADSAEKALRANEPSVRVRGATSARYDAIAPNGVHGLRIIGEADARPSSTLTTLFTPEVAVSFQILSSAADQPAVQAFVDGILATASIAAGAPAPAPSGARAPQHTIPALHQRYGEGSARPMAPGDAEALGLRIGQALGVLVVLGLVAVGVRHLVRRSSTSR